MRSRRKRRLLAALPVLALAAGGAVYMASNQVDPSYAGVSTFTVSCSTPPGQSQNQNPGNDNDHGDNTDQGNGKNNGKGKPQATPTCTTTPQAP